MALSDPAVHAAVQRAARRMVSELRGQREAAAVRASLLRASPDLAPWLAVDASTTTPAAHLAPWPRCCAAWLAALVRSEIGPVQEPVATTTGRTDAGTVLPLRPGAGDDDAGPNGTTTVPSSALVFHTAEPPPGWDRGLAPEIVRVAADDAWRAREAWLASLPVRGTYQPQHEPPSSGACAPGR